MKKILILALLCVAFVAHNHAALEVINEVKKLTLSTTEAAEEKTKKAEETKEELAPLQAAIDKGGDVDEADARGLTPLMWAAIKGIEPAVKLLINEQADINALNKRKESALMLAAKNKHEKVVVFLLGKKAKVDLQDIDGDTALILAVKHGAPLAIIDALIKANANLNLQNEAGNTAVIEAVIAGNKDVVNALVSAGADITIENKEKQTALAIAQKQLKLGIKNQEIISILQPAPVGPRNIIEAAQAGNSAVVEQFAKDRAKIDEADAQGFTPLMMAALGGYLSIVMYLIEQQADINALNKRKETALMFAAKNKHEKVVVFLLGKNAKVDLQDIDGDTALILAVKHGAPLAIIDALIKAKANLNLRNKVGSTALMEAVLTDRADVVELLVKAKAALDVTNEVGETALAIAQKRSKLGIKNQDIILILQPAPVGPRNIIEAAQAGNLKAVQAFIAQKVDLNMQNKWGITALIIAAQVGALPVVQALITAGADINKADAKGNTPLMMAVVENRAAVVKELVKHGALDIPNKQGQTPLQVVRQLVQKNRGFGKSLDALQNAHLDLIAVSRAGNLIDVKKYIAAKINLNGVDDKGQTALIAATIANKEPVVSALLGAEARADILDSVKKSALYYGVDAGYENLIRLLAPRSAAIINVPSNNVTILAAAKKRGRSPAIIALLQSAGAK